MRVGFAWVHLTCAWFRYARLADARRATQPAGEPLVELVETPPPLVVTPLPPPSCRWLSSSTELARPRVSKPVQHPARSCREGPAVISFPYASK